MTGIQVFFWIASAVLLFSALNVVTRKNLVHSALFLVVAFLGVAILFILLNAGFWAVMQVLVYIGAIAILMIFAVMLTPEIAGGEGNKYNSDAGWSAFISFVSFIMLGGLMSFWLKAGDAPVYDTDATVALLGEAFFTPDQFLVPAILASVLLLGGFIAAMVVARPTDGQE